MPSSASTPGGSYYLNNNSKKLTIHAQTLKAPLNEEFKIQSAENMNMRLDSSGGEVRIQNNMKVRNDGITFETGTILADHMSTSSSAVKIPITFNNYAFADPTQMNSNKTTVGNTWQNLKNLNYKVDFTPRSVRSKMYIKLKVNYVSSNESSQLITFGLYRSINNGTETQLFVDASMGTLMGVANNAVYTADYIDTPNTTDSICYYIKYKIEGTDIDIASGVLGNDDSNINFMMAQELYIPPTDVNLTASDGTIQSVTDYLMTGQDAVLGNLTVNGYLTMNSPNQILTIPRVNAGTSTGSTNTGEINNTRIGLTERAAGYFTSLQANGFFETTAGARIIGDLDMRGNVTMLSGKLLTVSDVDINGGSIDGTEIGASVRAHGYFNQMHAGDNGSIGQGFTVGHALSCGHGMNVGHALSVGHGLTVHHGTTLHSTLYVASNIDLRGHLYMNRGDGTIYHLYRMDGRNSHILVNGRLSFEQSSENYSNYEQRITGGIEMHGATFQLGWQDASGDITSKFTGTLTEVDMNTKGRSSKILMHGSNANIGYTSADVENPVDKILSQHIKLVDASFHIPNTLTIGCTSTLDASGNTVFSDRFFDISDDVVFSAKNMFEFASIPQVDACGNALEPNKHFDICGDVAVSAKDVLQFGAMLQFDASGNSLAPNKYLDICNNVQVTADNILEFGDSSDIGGNYKYLDICNNVSVGLTNVFEFGNRNIIKYRYWGLAEGRVGGTWGDSGTYIHFWTKMYDSENNLLNPSSRYFGAWPDAPNLPGDPSLNPVSYHNNDSNNWNTTSLFVSPDDNGSNWPNPPRWSEVEKPLFYVDLLTAKSVYKMVHANGINSGFHTPFVVASNDRVNWYVVSTSSVNSTTIPYVENVFSADFASEVTTQLSLDPPLSAGDPFTSSLLTQIRADPSFNVPGSMSDSDYIASLLTSGSLVSSSTNSYDQTLLVSPPIYSKATHADTYKYIDVCSNVLVNFGKNTVQDVLNLHANNVKDVSNLYVEDLHAFSSSGQIHFKDEWTCASGNNGTKVTCLDLGNVNQGFFSMIDISDSSINKILVHSGNINNVDLSDCSLNSVRIDNSVIGGNTPANAFFSNIVLSDYDVCGNIFGTAAGPSGEVIRSISGGDFKITSVSCEFPVITKAELNTAIFMHGNGVKIGYDVSDNQDSINKIRTLYLEVDSAPENLNLGGNNFGISQRDFFNIPNILKVHGFGGIGFGNSLTFSSGVTTDFSNNNIINVGTITGNTFVVNTDLSVNGTQTITGLLTANGGINCDSGNFTVTNDNGNVHSSGTLNVDGHVDLNSTVTIGNLLTVNGGITGENGLQIHNNNGNISTNGNITTNSGNIVISTGELHGPSVFVIDPATIGDNTGKVTIKGDLEIQGTQTTVNSTTVELNDNRMKLNASSSADAGLEVGFSDSSTASFVYENSSDTWKTGNKHLNCGSGTITSNALVANGHTDLNSSVTIDGELNIYGGLKSDSNKFTVANDSGNVFTNGTLTCNSTLTANGHTDLNSSVTIDGTLTAYGGINGDNGFSVGTGNGNIHTNGTLSCNSTFTANGHVDLNSNVTIDGTLTAYGQINGDNGFSVGNGNGNIHTNGTISCNSTLTVGSTLTANGHVDLNSSVTTDGTFTSHGHADLNSSVTIDGNLKVHGGIHNNEETLVEIGKVMIGGQNSNQNAAFFGHSSFLSDNGANPTQYALKHESDGDTWLNASNARALYFSVNNGNQISYNGSTLDMNQKTISDCHTITTGHVSTSTLNTDSTLTVGSTLTANGHTDLNSSVTIDGMLTAYGGINGDNGFSVGNENGNIHTNGTLSCNSTFTANGHVDLNSNVTIDGTLTAYGQINGDNGFSVGNGSGNIYTNGTIGCNSTLTVGSTLTAHGHVDLNSSVTIDGNLQVHGGIHNNEETLVEIGKAKIGGQNSNQNAAFFGHVSFLSDNGANPSQYALKHEGDGDTWLNASNTRVLYFSVNNTNQISYNGSTLDMNQKTITDCASVTANNFHGYFNGNVSGNSGTATQLQNARTIAGSSFNGTSNIDINYNNLTNKPTSLSQFTNNITIASSTLTGTIHNDRIPLLQTGKIPDLPASKITSGSFSANRISGTFTSSQIPSLNTSKITAGSFDPDRIPNLDTSKITSGSFSADRISGTFTSSQIPSLNTSKITTGIFTLDRIPTIDWSRIQAAVEANVDTTSSDDRLKHEEILITNATAVIEQLEPKYYKKTRDLSNNEILTNENKGSVWEYEAGLIAQEVNQVNELKEFVIEGDETNPWYLKYNDIFAYHMACTKELIQRINALEAEVTLLKNA